VFWKSAASFQGPSVSHSVVCAKCGIGGNCLLFHVRDYFGIREARKKSTTQGEIKDAVWPDQACQ
jgi:hypothetical protein